MASGALSLVLWLWSSLAAPSGQVRVWVVPHLVLPAAGAWQGKLVAVRVVNERLSAERLEIVISSDRPLASFSVPPLTDWRIEGEIAGFWVRPVRVSSVPNMASGGPFVAVPLDLWPLGKLTGRLERSREVAAIPLPRSIVVTTLPARDPAEKRPPAGKLDCLVGAGGTFSCDLPAARYDLTLETEGFSPTHLTRVEIVAGKASHAGQVLLRRGGALVGWVAVEGGVFDPENCRVRLLPAVSGGADPGLARALGGEVREAVPRADGFFHFSGLPRGTFRVEATHDPWPALSRAAVRVEEGVETVVDPPLEFVAPLTLTITVDPPLDGRDRAWRYSLLRETEGRGVTFGAESRGEFDREGVATIGGQRRGRYRLAIEDARGNRVAQVAEWRVEGAADAWKEIDLDIISARGTVHRGRQPVRGRLWFGGRSGPERVELEIDAEGVFEGQLPRAGSWVWDLAGVDPAFEVAGFSTVQADRKGRAEIQIRLDDTEATGVVVDARGIPLRGADVTLESRDNLAFTKTDARGEFSFRGFSAGPIQLSASHDRRAQPPKRVAAPRPFEALEGSRLGPITLVALETRRLAARVTEAGRAVLGASVYVWSRGAAVETSDRAISDRDGRVEVDLAPESQTAIAAIGAPQGALEVVALDLRSQEPTIALLGAHGDLAVVLPRCERSGLFDLELRVEKDGLGLPWTIFASWAHQNGGSLPFTAAEVFEIPRVAPGRYQICATGRGGTPVCDAGTLALGGRLVLNVSSACER